MIVKKATLLDEEGRVVDQIVLEKRRPMRRLMTGAIPFKTSVKIDPTDKPLHLVPPSVKAPEKKVPTPAKR